ncbi:MAG: potassium channel family protein [Candidatus Micrarchaeia archaeon]
MERLSESSWNVIISSIIISTVLIGISIVVLYLITNNAYLDAYYIIDTFFNAPNSAATWNLAQLALTYRFQKFAIVLAIVIIDNIGKLLVVSFVIAAVVDIVSFANLEKYISRVHAKRMKGHIIICGYNELSKRLIGELLGTKKKPKIVVIESNEEVIVELHHRHIPVIEGGCSSMRSLKLASADKAKMIVFVKQNDTENLIGAVEARKLNKEIKILVRGTKEEVMTKMYRAGADMCVLPEYLAGISMGEYIAKHLGVQK